MCRSGSESSRTRVAYRDLRRAKHRCVGSRTQVASGGTRRCEQRCTARRAVVPWRIAVKLQNSAALARTLASMLSVARTRCAVDTPAHRAARPEEATSDEGNDYAGAGASAKQHQAKSSGAHCTL
jgi:hypothetical protein